MYREKKQVSIFEQPENFIVTGLDRENRWIKLAEMIPLEKSKAVRWKNESRLEHFVFFSINGYTKQMKNLAAEEGNVFLFM